MYKNWLLDFDETLASGIITWGITRALPNLAREYDLAWDEKLLADALLVAQKHSSEISDPIPLMNEMFDAIGWDRAYQTPLMADLQANYRPEIYPDALPFLQHLREQGCSIFVVSNNKRTPKNVQALELSGLIDQVLTPALCPGCEPKPHRSLWDYLVGAVPDVTLTNSVVVGDDPWSEGTFAENCGLPCFLVDRLQRFGDLPAQYQRVSSLSDIFQHLG